MNVKIKIDAYEMTEFLTQIKDFETERMKEDNSDPRFIDGASFGMTFMIHRMLDYIKGDKKILIETYDIELDK